MSIKSFSYSLAAVLLSSTSAFAMTCLNDYSGTSGCAGNQTPAGDCSTLGYSKANVDGCVKYLYCPFDTSYKRCITQKAMDCSDYPLTKCPDNGFCSECNDGSTTKYKLDRCDNCFSQISVNGGMCSRNYQYDKCPTDAGAATCSECTYSGKTVYNILTCKPGYTLNGVVSNSRTCVKIADCDTLSECQSKIPQDGTTTWDYWDLKGNYSTDTKAGDATQICRYQTVDGSTCYKPEQINCADIDSLYGVYVKVAYKQKFDTIDECEDFIRPYNKDTGNNIKCLSSSLWKIAEGAPSNYILVSDGSVETCQTFIEWYNDNIVSEADKDMNNEEQILTCYSIDNVMGLGAHSLEATYKNGSGTTVKQVDLACAFPLSIAEHNSLYKGEELPSAPEPEFNCNDMNGLGTQEYCYSLGYTTYVPQDGSPCDPCPCSDMYCKDPRL